VPELRHMRYFVAVAEELNFSRAAERLHMAQPPLSAAIRQLERKLGTELFRRTTREVSLTDAGHAFLDGARRTLAEADRAVATARRAGAGDVGQLRLAFSWSVRFDTLPRLGQAFKTEHPDVELLVQEMWNAAMAPAVRAGTVDVAVAICPEPAPDVADELIRTEPVIAVLSAGHRLANEPAIPLAALAQEEFVLFPRDIAPRLHDAFVDLCRRAGFDPELRNESFHTFWALQDFAELTVVALAPTSVSAHLPEGLVAIPLADASDGLETRLLWRRPGSPAVEAFISTARGVYAAT
jgi:DNA-binding transcriptional LysR family regulator